MAYQVKPPDDQIDDVLNATVEQIDEGGSKFPGMSYEDGVQNGIMWVLGQNTSNPMDD